MLNHERLVLAIAVQSQSYRLLQWIGKAIDAGQIPVVSAERHADTPDAALDWLKQNQVLLPAKLRPDDAHLREFANFFWTYVTTSFDVIAQPGNRLKSSCGCLCPMCATIYQAPHLQPKKLTSADKRWAGELMTERVATLAEEQGLHATPEQCLDIVNSAATRRSAAFSCYGQWLINRLDGNTDGPAVLALWREIAWTRQGSPIQGFKLKYEDFQFAENMLIQAIRTEVDSPPAAPPTNRSV